ncbi:MAG: hypothetical protein IJ300_14155 [Clostridia bacterium]|nr:hypothetical protein [Clostridia bacterium]
MIKIKNGVDISYPVGDSFKMTVGRDIAFNTGDTLRLQIVRTEGTTPVIESTYNLNSSGEFDVVLQDSEKIKLQLGVHYKYRLTVIDINGNIDTEKSGNLAVEWGV